MIRKDHIPSIVTLLLIIICILIIVLGGNKSKSGHFLDNKNKPKIEVK